MNRRRMVYTLSLILVLCVCSPTEALAQAPPTRARKETESAVLAHPRRFQYAAKFICLSIIQGTFVGPSPLLNGSYTTLVNVHNPSEHPVVLRKKIALPGPGEEAGERSKWIEHKLPYDGVFSLECKNITKDFGIGIPVHGAEGFLVIESTGSLDVTAVYTAGHGDVESIAVEQIRERILK